jgi:hypothetical protein
MAVVKKFIRIDDKLWHQAKLTALTENMELMTENGWIVQAIKEKLTRKVNLATVPPG